MKENSINRHTPDNQDDRTQQNDRSKQDSRYNTSSSDQESAESLERSNERRDRLPKGVPDNYERDSE